MMYKFSRFLLNLIVRLTTRPEIIGYDSVPFSGAFIAASNHLGRMDVALVYYILKDRDDIILLVAEKYRENPLLAWFVKQVDAIYIDRYNADFAALRETLRRLRNGGVLVMAPEGTRSPTGALIEARSGASYMAAKAGVKILPVALTGTEDSNIKAHLLRFKRAQVIIHAGEPFTLAPLPGRDRDEAFHEYTDEIMCRIAALLPPEYRGVYADHPRLQELLAEENQPLQAE